MKNDANQYAAMGMAALLPGLQYAVEMMQKNLDEFREQLAALQSGAKPTKAKRVVSEEGRAAIAEGQRRRWEQKQKGERGSKVKAYWARMTPEERAAEMRRRDMIRAKKATPKKAARNHAQNPNHPKHAEWLEKRKKYPSRQKNPPVVKLDKHVNGAAA